uniref:Cysteine-rich protein 1 n=1 Tax=Fundulus heteroclitus TaxID=8078 RepID=A0A3Q2NNM0_FUNHE
MVVRGGNVASDKAFHPFKKNEHISHYFQVTESISDLLHKSPSVPLSERVSSLGKDWHRPCLKCEKCNKTLSAGSHAEHEGKPYCNNPCYAALFGPKGFGRGGAESHTYK